MKILLYMFGSAAIFIPLVIWSFMSDIACANGTSPADCGLTLGDFFDWDFLNIAFLPWAIAAMCFISGYRRGSN